MRWPFSKPKVELSWSSLSAAQKKAVARKLAGAALGLARRAHFGKGFEVVTYPYANGRRPTYVERGGEDSQISSTDRAKIVNAHRDMMRNSPTRITQDQQLRVNVVGSCGGKMYASFPPEYKAAADEVMHYFNRVWFTHAEFTFRKNFNWILKTVLTAQDVNGNVVLVFDDGELTGGNGTGRVRGFEGDEIANISDAAFARAFPKGWCQRGGFIYNESGMFAGCFVSTRHRGCEAFPDEAGAFHCLRLDPFNDGETPNWILLGDMRRFNQGRAVSPLTAAITCLIDLHETVASETQAAKMNAQLVGQILSNASADGDAGEAPQAFDDEIERDTAAKPAEVTFSTRELSAIGAHFDQMPVGMKIDLLDTKRPNANIPAYIEFLTGLVGGTKGLARVYSTLKAQTSYTAFRGEQAMTKPSFDEAKTDLEREVCDWIAVCVISRAVKLGLVKSALPDGWRDMIAWRWPEMPEVDLVKAEDARRKRLENGVTSLARELGPGELEKIVEERKREKQLFEDAGLDYPGMSENQETETTTDEGGDDA